MLSIYKKELRAFFNSIIGYLVIIIFLTISGLFTWVFPGNVLDQEQASMYAFFSFAPYILLLLIPAITMRVFAEEKKTGTIELLMSRPITEWQLILGKYLGSLTLVLISILPTLVYYFSLSALGQPTGNIDTAAIIGSYIGLVFLVMAYTALGVFASSITENQIIAFLTALILCYAMYDSFVFLSELNEWSGFSLVIKKLGFGFHYEALSRGVIDSRNVIYFISITGFLLASTRLVLGTRKW